MRKAKLLELSSVPGSRNLSQTDIKSLLVSVQDPVGCICRIPHGEEATLLFREFKMRWRKERGRGNKKRGGRGRVAWGWEWINK